MEKLLHYVWKHKLFPLSPLITDDGRIVEVLDVGVYNQDEGPDFFNAKLKLDDIEWVGNIEIHLRSSDWQRHYHHNNQHYDNVILHIVETIDQVVKTTKGKPIPQLALPIPSNVRQNYDTLLSAEQQPPCRLVVERLPKIKQHAWLNALTIERLEQKIERILLHLEQTNDDWQRVLFITLARNFGFSVNADTFERWAYNIPLSAIGKHRDHIEQVEAFFLGQAGFFEQDAVVVEHRDEYYHLLKREYQFLQHKFRLTPLSFQQWKFLRVRPQNFPTIRLVQFAQLYHLSKFNFSAILSAQTMDDLRPCLQVGVTPYWETHYDFGQSSKPCTKILHQKSIDLLFINTIIPLLFAYGRIRFQENICEKAFEWLEQLPAEDNHISRLWQQAGVSVNNAAESQALLTLHHAYCETKKCLYCRFGTAFLQQSTTP